MLTVCFFFLLPNCQWNSASETIPPCGTVAEYEPGFIENIFDDDDVLFVKINNLQQLKLIWNTGQMCYESTPGCGLVSPSQKPRVSSRFRQNDAQLFYGKSIWRSLIPFCFSRTLLNASISADQYTELFRHPLRMKCVIICRWHYANSSAFAMRSPSFKGYQWATLKKWSRQEYIP